MMLCPMKFGAETSECELDRCAWWVESDSDGALVRDCAITALGRYFAHVPFGELVGEPE